MLSHEECVAALALLEQLTTHVADCRIKFAANLTDPVIGCVVFGDSNWHKYILRGEKNSGQYTLVLLAVTVAPNGKEFFLDNARSLGLEVA